MANIQQGFPQLSSPIAQDENLRVTQPWLQFFISLWNRTGAQQGNATFNPGDLKAIAGQQLPDGWLLCDGSAASRTVYVALFNAIGTLWGSGDNVTTFNLPDFRGRALIGATDTFPLATTGGASTAVLSISNLPAHNHDVTDTGHTHTITDPGHSHTAVTPTTTNTAGSAVGTSTSGNTGSSVTGIAINNAFTGVTTQNTGSGVSFSILSPYAVVQWIIKT